MPFASILYHSLYEAWSWESNFICWWWM